MLLKRRRRAHAHEAVSCGCKGQCGCKAPYHLTGKPSQFSNALPLVTTFLEQTREQKYSMEHIAIDTDELDNLVEKLKVQGINILEQTTISGGRRVCFFEGPDGVQLEFIEMKS